MIKILKEIPITSYLVRCRKCQVWLSCEQSDLFVEWDRGVDYYLVKCPQCSNQITVI